MVSRAAFFKKRRPLWDFFKKKIEMNWWASNVKRALKKITMQFPIPHSLSSLTSTSSFSLTLFPSPPYLSPSSLLLLLSHVHNNTTTTFYRRKDILSPFSFIREILSCFLRWFWVRDRRFLAVRFLGDCSFFTDFSSSPLIWIFSPHSLSPSGGSRTTQQHFTDEIAIHLPCSSFVRPPRS